jgi:chromosomal replication initiation ATPase DnaA
LRGRDRSRRASVARSVAAGLLYATGRYTHREIAEALGRRHHTASVYLVGRSASHADTARAVAQYIRDREGE